MSIRQKTGANANPFGSSIDPDFNVPSCTIEDVDRALFNLFDKQLELYYELKGNTKRVPVIFATGERFAILRRKKPLRDKAGALILPLISIMRSGVEQDVTRGMGTNQNAEITIKKKLSPKDPTYQRLVNKELLRNQDNRADPSHYIPNNVVGAKDGMGTEPGTVAKRRAESVKTQAVKKGELLKEKLGNNIFEIYTIPAPKYFSASYEVTIWTQYTQQMNNFLMSIASSYHNNSAKSFRIESDKGYYFVAYFGDSLSPANNFDDFTDDERIIKYTLTVEVPGYIVNPTYPGSQPTHRKYISAPQITFDMTQVSGIPSQIEVAGIRSGDPGDYILQDLNTISDPAVSHLVAKDGVAANSKFYKTTMVGGESSGNDPLRVKRVYTDPDTGELVKQELKIKTRNQRKGETVYREQITYDLGTLVIEPK
jgi:hypothetical protein